MGNEQGSPYLQQKQQQSSSNSGTSSPYDFESLIVIRGERKTGKSTLVSRMKGQNFNPTYSPTPGLEVFQFPWKLNSSHCNNVMISIWDVVEHSIPQKVESENSTPLPDAQSIDTLKRANGLVIMIDYRNDRSIELADRLISEAPEECQVVVFSNFYGEESVPPTIPKKLRNHVGRFSFILGNLRTNLGLVALSKWLQLPLLSAKRKMFADLFRATDNDLHQLEDEFVENSKNFLQRNSALAQIPRGNPNMNYYANVGASVSNEQAVRKSNVSPSSSQASQPTKLERPSVFAEPIQPRKRKPMPFCNNTGGSFNGEEKKEDPDDNDDDFWSDNENDESNDSFVPHAQSKKDNLRPNPMVQAAAPKKTMKQIIEENTIKPENTDQKIDNINPVNNSNNQKLRKKKKKVNHMNTQNKELINDHCQSSSSEGENDQDQLIKQQQKQEIINSNVNENEVVTQNKPKAIFTTTLVLEEEDEEDQVENAASPQTNTIFNQPAVVNENQTTNKKVENNKDNEDEFWSDNDNDDNIETKAQDLQLNIQENDEDEALTKPNPLVQKVKPRSNPYQNIIPKTQNETEKNPIDTSSSQISNNEPKEETEKININTSQINNNNEQKEETEKIITNIQQINNKEEQKNEKEEQKQNSSQTVTKPSTTSNNDDDDFWNFEPVSNQKVVSEAIKKKKLMKQKVAHNESKQKERPLVIPKSQVAQRTITVQQNKLSYDQQQKQQQLIQQQNPVIPTTDLFSDLNESKNDEFFQPAKPNTNILIKSSQKTDQSVTKTVRKRKRVVKSSGGNSANKNDQTPSSGYDSI